MAKVEDEHPNLFRGKQQAWTDPETGNSPFKGVCLVVSHEIRVIFDDGRHRDGDGRGGANVRSIRLDRM